MLTSKDIVIRENENTNDVPRLSRTHSLHRCSQKAVKKEKGRLHISSLPFH